LRTNKAIWLATEQTRGIVVGVRTNQPVARRLRVRKDALRKAAREVLGVETDYALAVALDIHPSTLSLLMTGQNQPSEKFIVAALDHLGRPFEDLIEVIDEEPDGAAA
jgi:transcriptional regulator with XRE-family HTH domain